MVYIYFKNSFDYNITNNFIIKLKKNKKYLHKQNNLPK